MKKINLLNGGVAIIDDKDYELICRYAWYNFGGYATSTGSKMIKMHRLILSPEDNKEVDHINTDRLDNRRCNLRECTHAENMRNKRKRIDSTSKYKGVCLHKPSGLWAANLCINGTIISLKYHKTEKEAAAAYDVAAKKHHGEFAFTNDTKLDIIDFHIPDKTDIYDYTRIQQELLSFKSPLSLAESQETNKALTQCIAGLPSRERMVIGLRFGLNESTKHTLKTIGGLFHLSKERIRQIIRDVLLELKKQLLEME